jgi:hypothetical protein
VRDHEQRPITSIHEQRTRPAEIHSGAFLRLNVQRAVLDSDGHPLDRLRAALLACIEGAPPVVILTS